MINRILDSFTDFKGMVRAVLIFLLVVWISHYIIVELGEAGRSGYQIIKTDSILFGIIQLILSFILYLLLIIPGLIYGAIRWIYSPGADFDSHSDPYMIFIVGSLTVIYAFLYLSENSYSLSNILKTKKRTSNGPEQGFSGHTQPANRETSENKTDDRLNEVLKRSSALNELRSLYKKASTKLATINDLNIVFRFDAIDQNIYNTLHTNLDDRNQTWYIFCSDAEFHLFIKKTTKELNEFIRIADEFIKEERERARRKRESSGGQITKEKAFKLFGLETTATKEEIRAKYKELVKKYNSDHRADLEEHIKELLDNKMKEINVARDYLRENGYI